MAPRMDALRRCRALKSGFVVLLSKWTVFHYRSIWTGKRFETLQGVCDEKTVCRSAKSVKGQPLKAARTALENLSFRAYHVLTGRQGATDRKPGHGNEGTNWAAGGVWGLRHGTAGTWHTKNGGLHDTAPRGTKKVFEKEN